MGKIMGWDKKRKDVWGNWTGLVSVKKKGKAFTVMRNKIDLIKVEKQKYPKTKVQARLWAVKWMKRNPHYKKYVSRKKRIEIDRRIRGSHTSGFRSLNLEKWR
jgi:hypothetical protein